MNVGFAEISGRQVTAVTLAIALGLGAAGCGGDTHPKNRMGPGPIPTQEAENPLVLPTIEPMFSESPEASASASASAPAEVSASTSPTAEAVAPHPTPTKTAATKAAGGAVLSATTYCAWSPSNPMPGNILDGRCSPDREGSSTEPVTKTASNGTAVYNNTELTLSARLGRVPDGSHYSALCVVPNGAPVTDKAGHESTDWVIANVTNSLNGQEGVPSGKGFLPAVSTGYNIHGLRSCTLPEINQAKSRH